MLSHHAFSYHDYRLVGLAYHARRANPLVTMPVLFQALTGAFKRLGVRHTALQEACVVILYGACLIYYYYLLFGAFVPQYLDLNHAPMFCMVLNILT